MKRKKKPKRVWRMWAVVLQDGTLDLSAVYQHKPHIIVDKGEHVVPVEVREVR